MADNDQNDEYNFAELDSTHNPSSDTTNFHEYSSQTSPVQPRPKKDVKRNAIIVVLVSIVVIVMYKIIGGYYSSSKQQDAAEKNNIQPIQSVAKPVQNPIPSSVPVVVPIQTDTANSNTVLKEKIASFETSQQNVQTQVSSVNQQVDVLNNNITSLSAQVTKLNQMVTELSNTINKQNEEIVILTERTKPKQHKHIVRTRSLVPANIYYINAVIPGRAWLIGSNGSTLTIREGTQIPGYGLVKLIDSIEGRILTSTGRVIRFSQADS